MKKNTLTFTPKHRYPVDLHVVQFSNSRLDESAAANLVKTIIPETETEASERAARALAAIILKLAFDGDDQRRSDNGRALLKAAFGRTLDHEMAYSEFIDSADLEFVGQFSGTFPATAELLAAIDEKLTPCIPSH
jgi:hypothetical protein